jgi:hypothetical protein
MMEETLSGQASEQAGGWAAVYDYFKDCVAWCDVALYGMRYIGQKAKDISIGNGIATGLAIAIKTRIRSETSN